eukprot:3512480-Alexandrium_andersonii.AAC.1
MPGAGLRLGVLRSGMHGAAGRGAGPLLRAEAPARTGASRAVHRRRLQQLRRALGRRKRPAPLGPRRMLSR